MSWIISDYFILLSFNTLIIQKMDRRFVETMTEKPKTSTKFPKTDSSILFPRYSATIQKEKLSSKNWKKPKDMPRRPLSAYNLFFKSERERLLAPIHEECTPEIRKSKSVGIGFAGLAREIAKKWKSLDKSERSSYEREAETEKKRYTEGTNENESSS
jgi:HMG-box domain